MGKNAEQNIQKEKNEQSIEEQRLLSQTSLDDLIRLKMEEEINAEFEKASEISEKIVLTSISEVAPELIFSKQAVYKVFNKKNKVQTYINGIQAESMLGMQIAVRNKIQSGQMDAFSTANAYVKFEKIEI